VLGEVHKNKGWRRLATCTKQANVSASTEKELPMAKLRPSFRWR
jgi:hypothetical protein